MSRCFAKRSELLGGQNRASRRGSLGQSKDGRFMNRPYNQSTKEISQKNCCFRIYLLIAFFTVFGGGLITRLYVLQHSEYSKWHDLASRQHKSEIEVKGARGNIFDVKGKSLAVSVKSFSLGVHPEYVKDDQDFAKGVSQFVSQSTKEVLEKISDKSKNFVWLARGIPEDVANEVHQLAPRAVSPVSEFSRYYPQGQLAGSLLGWVGRDGKGLSGVELNFDSKLRAGKSKRFVRRDARGRLMSVDEVESDSMLHAISLSPVSSAHATEGLRKEGGDIWLTIDADIQGILEEELARGQEEAKAKRIFALMVDAENGDIIATAQTPFFNPNLKTKLTPSQLRNPIIQDNFEPGSTFKPLIAAVAMDNGKAFPDEVMDCENGRYKVGPHIVKDVHPVGVVPFPEILVRSSNVCMSKLGQRLGEKKLYTSLVELGFGKRSGIELPGEARGILRHRRTWKEIDVATHSFGQGIAVTALQLVQAYTALANGGLMSRPRLLKSEDSDQKRVFSEETAERITEMLYGVTELQQGTGKNAKVAGLRIAGKTGTAQKARLDGRGYEKNKILASFIGYADASSLGVKRKLVMLVAVDEPGVMPRWGGVVAAPVFSRVMQRAVSHMLVSEGGYKQTVRLGRGGGNQNT